MKTAELRMLEFGDKHRRDAVDDCRSLGVDCFERSEGIERGGGKDAGCAANSRSHRADNGPKAVEHWHGNADAILFSEAHALDEETSVVHQVHVRKQHALGLAGRAGSVLNVRGLTRIWVGGNPVWLAQEVFHWAESR